MSLSIITLDEARSTNTVLAEMCDATHGTVVTARAQTAGRGQRGNTWESEPGKNLTFSLMLRPRNIAARRQFELSMAVSLGIVEALDKYLDASRLTIKWPNDIYYDNLKLAGILIENSLSAGGIDRSIVGVGLNVNQTRFVSDAPNPVSLSGICGHEFDLDTVLTEVCTSILERFDAHDAGGTDTALVEAYRRRLWRGDGRYYPWHDVRDGRLLSGVITNVRTDGTLEVTDTDGNKAEYLFKEIAAVL
jgi:BirA family biotin operon repressor/biotin-[acetyl-CoA-carboxylase] ligase